MVKYTVVFSRRVDDMMLRHIAFLARVSVPAAKRLRAEFGDLLRQIEQNPYQFPGETDPNLSGMSYRKALFARRYKALFLVDGSTVYLDAVVDCRLPAEHRDLIT